MELKLIELTHKSEVCKIYEIYKHCMYMPNEEKFNEKIDQFLNDNSIKIFACLNEGEIEGVIVVCFVEQSKIEITNPFTLWTDRFQLRQFHQALM